jgi:hypothetical protein
MTIAKVLILVIVGLILYFLPATVAFSRKKTSSGAIFALNLLAGWTVLGWIGAFVWACTQDSASQIIVERQAPMAPPALCSQCGKYSAAGVKFCGSCGAAIAALVMALIAFLSVSAGAFAQGRPTIVVGTFAVAEGAQWPYDAGQMQAQTIVELRIKDGKKFDVENAAPSAVGPVYTLSGEILEWRPGNRAKRMIVGMGTGRETAKIHYWLTDSSGKRVFEHTDTIRQAVWYNAYAPSAGQLAQPFADKIAERLKDSRL